MWVARPPLPMPPTSPYGTATAAPPAPRAPRQDSPRLLPPIPPIGSSLYVYNTTTPSPALSHEPRGERSTLPTPAARARTHRQSIGGPSHGSAAEDHRGGGGGGGGEAEQEEDGGVDGHGAVGGRRGGGGWRAAEGAAAAGGLRGAPRVPQGQRVHPRPLPRGVAHPRRPPQRLLLAQRDAQRLDAFGRVPAVPGARRRRRREGGGARGRPGDHEVCGWIGQCFMEERSFGPAEPRRGGDGPGRARRRAAVAADGVPRGRDGVPGHQRDGAPAGVPLPPRHGRLLAAGLRRHLHHDRRLLRAARVLRVPLPPVPADRLPLRHHRPWRARRGRAALAVLLLAAVPPPPRHAVPRHGTLRRHPRGARALGQLGPHRVLPGAGARGGPGARLRRRRVVLRQPRAGEVAPRRVRRRWTQPPDLPRLRARRRHHALRRRRRAASLA